MYPVINSIKSGEFSGINMTKFLVRLRRKKAMTCNSKLGRKYTVHYFNTRWTMYSAKCVLKIMYVIRIAPKFRNSLRKYFLKVYKKQNIEWHTQVLPSIAQLLEVVVLPRMSYSNDQCLTFLQIVAFSPKINMC